MHYMLIGLAAESYEMLQQVVVSACFVRETKWSSRVLVLSHSLSKTNRSCCNSLNLWIVLRGATRRKASVQENMESLPEKLILMLISVRGVLLWALYMNNCLTTIVSKCSIFRTWVVSCVVLEMKNIFESRSL